MIHSKYKTVLSLIIGLIGVAINAFIGVYVKNENIFALCVSFSAILIFIGFLPSYYKWHWHSFGNAIMIGVLLGCCFSIVILVSFVDKYN